MDNKSLTPEEKLLRLIKEGAKPEKELKPAEQPAPQKTNMSNAMEPVQEQAVPTQNIKPSLDAQLKNFFTIGNINKILFILFFLVIIYVLYSLATFIMSNAAPGAKAKNGINLKLDEKALPAKNENEQAKSAQPQPIDYYLQDIQKKDIFKSVIVEKAGAINSAATQPAKAKLEEIAKYFSLKGIIEGNKLQAVIEDTRAGKTYFVTKGENIGDVTIDDITETKVKIRLEDQTTDLTL